MPASKVIWQGLLVQAMSAAGLSGNATVRAQGRNIDEELVWTVFETPD